MKAAPVPSFRLLRAGAAMQINMGCLILVQINMRGLILERVCLQSHMLCVMLLLWDAAFCCSLEALDAIDSKGYNVYEVTQ